MTNRKYEGRWVLVPELSFYQEGEIPQAGRYDIDVLEKDISFSVHWVVNEEEHSLEFTGPLDGQLHSSEVLPEAYMSYTHVDDQTLESSLVVNDIEVAFARRQVSNDGDLLAVLQVNRKANGSIVRISQVYRRSQKR